MSYSFTVEFIPGKSNIVADALSRATVWEKKIDSEDKVDEETIKSQYDKRRAKRNIKKDPNLSQEFRRIVEDNKTDNLLHLATKRKSNNPDHFDLDAAGLEADDILSPEPSHRHMFRALYQTRPQKEDIASLKKIFTSAAKDEHYKAIIKAVEEKQFKAKDIPKNHPAHSLKDVFDRISIFPSRNPDLPGILVLDTRKIIIPEADRVRITNEVHQQSHAGPERMKSFMRTRYFWVKMNSLIEDTAAKCHSCIEAKTSNPTQPLLPPPPEFSTMEPMDEVAVDVYHVDNRDKYMATVDRASSFTTTRKIKADTTEEILLALNNYFMAYGLPKVIRSDNGPSFRKSFTKAMEDLGITHSNGSPHHHAGQGLVEGGISRIRKLHNALQKEGMQRDPKSHNFNVDLVSLTSILSGLISA